MLELVWKKPWKHIKRYYFWQVLAVWNSCAAVARASLEAVGLRPRHGGVRSAAPLEAVWPIARAPRRPAHRYRMVMHCSAMFFSHSSEASLTISAVYITMYFYYWSLAFEANNYVNIKSPSGRATGTCAATTCFFIIMSTMGSMTFWARIWYFNLWFWHIQHH